MTNYDILKEYEAHNTPVPSYEEYSRLEWYAGCGPDRIVELNKENRQLRQFCEEFNALKVAEENEQLKLIIKRTKASGNYPSRVSQYKARITVLTEENAKLKELLKRCRDFINYEVPDHCIDDVLIDKIDEVLK